ncbi:MAG: multiheme c-type cytochrome [bacterium]
MKNFVILVLLSFILATPSSAKDHAYLGVKKCRKCHSVQDKDYYDNTFEIWTNMKHKKAFEVLASPEALAVAKRFNIKEPQKEKKCLQCHTTAFKVSNKHKKKFFHHEDGVICEACHGAGSGYKKRKNHAYSLETAMSNGLTLWDSNELKLENCKKCHSDESTKICHDRLFSLDMWKEIVHPTEVFVNGSKFTVVKQEVMVDGKKSIVLQRFKDGQPITREEWKQQVRVAPPEETGGE